MKNQILELLASPSVENTLAFLKNLIQVPQESPLVAAITAGVFGLFIAMMINRWRSRRHQRRINDSWETRLHQLDKSHAAKLTELRDSKDSLANQVVTLQNKLQSTEQTLDQDRSTLHKVNANVKSLEVSAAEKDQKIQQTIDDAAHKIAQHQSSLKKVNALLETRTTELSQLKASQKNSGGIRINESLLNSINERDDGYAEQLAKRIATLDAQRSTLLRERDEFASKEALYTDQLPDGEDTSAYLDDTIAMNDELDHTINTKPNSDNTPLDELENTLAVERPSDNQPEPAESPGGKPTRESSSLWDRVKTTVVKTTDTQNIEKSDA